MFTNILRKKRLLNGDHVETNYPGHLFYSKPLDVLDTLYVIYKRCNMEDEFIHKLGDFIGGRYGSKILSPPVLIQALVRAMILTRYDLPMREYYFKKAIGLIKNTRGVVNSLSQEIKNIINTELGDHYIEFHGDINSAFQCYQHAMQNVRGTRETSIFRHNLCGSGVSIEHCYDIDDIVNIEVSEMYHVLRVGFVVHATEKGTRSWFMWNKKNRFKELFVLVVEMYSKLRDPLCGPNDLVGAINEFLLTFTTDPPVSRWHNVTLDLMEKRYETIKFDRDTRKFRWYI